MKRILTIFAAVALAAASPALAKGGGGHSSGGYSSRASSGSHASTGVKSSRTSPSEHLVSGYTRKNGTHVAAHYQTNPNSTKTDNYSTKGNVNPHTGKAGTKPGD
jgi:hypothetical protein